MTSDEFNEKYKDHLEEGHYGLAIGNEEVVNYLDEKFQELIPEFPDLEYAQIKTKFGFSRFYSNLPHEINMEIEKQIDKILRDDN